MITKTTSKMVARVMIAPIIAHINPIDFAVSAAFKESRLYWKAFILNSLIIFLALL